MGLDMYLRAEQYVSGYEFSEEAEQSAYKNLVNLFEVGEYIDPDTPSANVDFTVGYWRKANAIHQWFVENVQGGEDECRPHSVSREQLAELREACKKVLTFVSTKKVSVAVDTITKNGFGTTIEKHRTLTRAGKGAASQVLPTQSGFFFGGTDYDEWYIQDAERTIEIIERALAMPGGWYFEYQSSW